MKPHFNRPEKVRRSIFGRSTHKNAQTIEGKGLNPLRRSIVSYRENLIDAIDANGGFPLKNPLSEEEGGFAVTAPSAALQGADHRTPLCVLAAPSAHNRQETTA
ncbi:MAG: hypothetical protein H3C30_16240 [Candidatus Hydrogenedentes bacterium]|nr:hypothetical protein [Candidatus Hydrogenedentota bacterium]